MNKGRTVLEAKRLGVFTCQANGILREASQKMVSEDVSSLVVVDEDGSMCGIITRTDFLRAYLDHSDSWMNQPTCDYMSEQVVTVPPATKLLEVAQILTNNHIHRVVVIREENGVKRPISVVSDSDLLYHMVKES